MADGRDLMALRNDAAIALSKASALLLGQHIRLERMALDDPLRCEAEAIALELEEAADLAETRCRELGLEKRLDS